MLCENSVFPAGLKSRACASMELSRVMSTTSGNCAWQTIPLSPFLAGAKKMGQWAPVLHNSSFLYLYTLGLPGNQASAAPCFGCPMQ
jgi:hypothetical protein